MGLQFGIIFHQIFTVINEVDVRDYIIFTLPSVCHENKITAIFLLV